ncbi:MAG TPA: hypothetical protein VLA89_10050 [Gemmatimonadales bacterium]|nr:hypothetical protein [Gemmatimonadales bacterium]
MKVLFLGNSNELYGDIPEAERRTSRAALALEEAFGEPVETVVRTIWPTAKLPGTIEKWMGEFEPDVVYLNVVAFWFNFQSVPLKVERMLGPPGRPLKDAGIKASQLRWLGHTAVFHWLREMCQRVIGGATFFEPDEVTEVISDCVRTVIRHEQAVLVLKGPRGATNWNVTEKRRAWTEERRLRVHYALEALSRELHVDYVGQVQPRYDTNPWRDLQGDRMHSGGEGHKESGEEIAGMLKAAWERHRAPV